MLGSPRFERPADLRLGRIPPGSAVRVRGAWYVPVLRLTEAEFLVVPEDEVGATPPHRYRLDIDTGTLVAA